MEIYFETNIARETINPQKCLAYLIQHCRAEAREAIENRSIFHPESGYNKAREILEHQFGRPHVVVQSHLKLITNGPQIKPMDGSGLQRFARQMQNCELTLDVDAKMGWSEDLNNGETLLRTVDHLPQFMQLQWAEKAESILKSILKAIFADRTRFVEDKANVATNMFGKHIIESKRKSRDLPKTVANEA